MVIQGQLAGIWRYPVSSLGGERLDRAEIGPRGLLGDRTFGLFDNEDGAHIYPARDARWNPAPLLSARLTANGPELSVNGTDWASADTPDMQAQVAQVLGRPASLRAYDAEIRPRYNVAPLHLLSLQAMAALRRAIPDSAIDARRFRPNLLVDLPDLAGEIPEYALLGVEFSLGGLRLRGTVPCGRCGFTSLPVGDGLPEDPAVLRTLVRRFERNFGIYCEVIDAGTLHVAAPLHATASAQGPGPVVIVGGGQAGVTAARALRKHGYVGPIRIFAAERHLPYERPPLSKHILNPGAIVSPLLSAQDAATANLALDLATPVEAIDLNARQVETADGSIVSFGTLILAMGGLARRLPGLNRGHGRVHELRSQDDAARLSGALHPGTRLFILGGGWIGMEIAAAARIAGAEVSLFVRSTALAPHMLPPVVSDALTALHRAHGITLHFGVEPRFHETETGVRCEVGGQHLTADHLLLAIGMVANDGLARRAGLDCANGILTDETGATSHEGVFAIGDVALPPSGRFETWQNANLQADRVARHILGQPAPPPEPLRFWSEQFGHRVQVVGRPDPKASLLSQSGQFWDFGSFAVGIDTPEAIHRAARRLSLSEPVAPGTPAPAPTAARKEYLLCPAADVTEGALLRIEHSARGALCATRQGGQTFVTDDRCPHAVASLSEGFVDDGRLICPLHFAEFDLRSGAPHHAPEGCGALTVHPTSERDGQIFVSLPHP
ncbi:FAD-dependent oxidoreductase [Roseicitreum antarcticum]|uniref:NADPH-dependent 2,4-dienoyl-CoA reductase, sulfur reductase n=1 Tax=Roseicitreum antarcticum TaxID=564137 RepID=A0A1H3DFP4_9RHOB|nr:FAD-dependent oxidoreductase [Roseicitreum antarcticum]SDX64519.1 NADPH-dependent 2,4-dienoyl-CoA reductase, sulfur reductase [Roseicitreum antarcticum]